MVYEEGGAAEDRDHQHNRRQGDQQHWLGNPALIVIVATGWAIAASVSTITEAARTAEAIWGPSVPRAASGPPATALATAGAAAATGATASPRSTHGSAIRSSPGGLWCGRWRWDAKWWGRLWDDWQRSGLHRGEPGKITRGARWRRALRCDGKGRAGQRYRHFSLCGPARSATGDGHVTAILLINAL
jgi:hypothetical protein